MEEKENFNYDVDSDLKLEDETQENTNQDKKESSEELFQNDKDESQKLVSRITKYKNEHKIKFYVIISAILVVIIATIATVIPVSIISKRNERYKEYYNDLMFELEYFDDYSINQIDTIIDKLPDDYRDLKTIKSQYKNIKKYATVLIENDSLNSYLYEEGSSDKVREAYKQLKIYSSIYLEWNLEDFLDSIKLEVLIFDVEWKNSSGSYGFNWTYYDNLLDKRLISSIPSDRESDKNYYYTTEIRDEYIIFGYKNKENSSDEFYAFRVSNFRYTNSQFYIDVYCFKNFTKETYTFI